MRDQLSAYKTWAPDGALWTQWTKPVLFSYPAVFCAALGDPFLEIPTVNWMHERDSRTAVIIDLPGEQGVLEGLALARMGYRPVPLYNGVYSPNAGAMEVDVTNIAMALFDGADMLDSFDIRSDASPVFLLDSRRMNGSIKHPGRYDNRWCVFPQDMPSASFLLSQGIDRIVVRSDKIRDDLNHILLRYQEKGIKIYLHTGDMMEEEHIVKPAKYKSLVYRFKVIAKLTRNTAGGFGGQIPEITQYSSGSGVYRSGYHSYG